MNSAFFSKLKNYFIQNNGEYKNTKNNLKVKLN